MNKEDVLKFINDQTQFMDWLEKRIKTLVDIGIYDVNYIEYNEDTDKFYISWESSHGEYNDISIDWSELEDETDETFKAAQAERNRVEELRRVERAQVEAARALARAQRMQSIAEQDAEKAGFDLEEWKSRHGVE